MSDTAPLVRPSTFSIVAADPEANEVGIAVQSKFLAVGAVVPWAQGGVGALAVQAYADVSFGPEGLKLLLTGLDPADVLEELLKHDKNSAGRQIGIVSSDGKAQSFTGSDCFEYAGSVTGNGYACQGNILASDDVVPAMGRTFEKAEGTLARRMIAALHAGQAAGGDRRGRESACLYIAKPNGGYGGKNDRYIDLRVDHHKTPIAALSNLLDLHYLYFERPNESDLVDVGPELEAELLTKLNFLGWETSENELWETLMNYMGWENLEERWVSPGKIDPKVLRYIQEQAQIKEKGQSS